MIDGGEDLENILCNDGMKYVSEIYFKFQVFSVSMLNFYNFISTNIIAMNWFTHYTVSLNTFWLFKVILFDKSLKVTLVTFMEGYL